MSVLKLRKTPLNYPVADFRPKVLCSSQIDRKQKKLEKHCLIKFNVCSEAPKLKPQFLTTSRRHSLSANLVIKDHEIRSIPKQGSVNFPRTWKERSIVKETNYQSQALFSMVSFAPAKSAGMPNACDGRSVVPDLDTMCISIAFSYSLNALTT